MSFFSNQITSGTFGDYCYRCRNYSPLCTCMAQYNAAQQYSDYIAQATRLKWPDIASASLSSEIDKARNDAIKSIQSKKPNKLLLLLR